MVRLTSDPSKPHLHRVSLTQRGAAVPVSHSVHIWAMGKKRLRDILYTVKKRDSSLVSKGHHCAHSG